MTYFLLDNTFHPHSIGDDFFRWVSWHSSASSLCRIGEDVLSDGSRLLTWFYGHNDVLWETLELLATGAVGRHWYYATFQDALLGHLTLSGVLTEH